MTDYQPTAFSRELCARLRGLIARYDLNQLDLASLCDVSQSQFSKIIRGVRPITIDQVAVLCDALDVDIVDLFTSIEAYIGDRSLHASPIRLVDDEDRLAPAEFWNEAIVKLDDWAVAAKERIVHSEFDDAVIVGRFGESATEEDERMVAKTKDKRDRGGLDGRG